MDLQQLDDGDRPLSPHHRVPRHALSSSDCLLWSLSNGKGLRIFLIYLMPALRWCKRELMVWDKSCRLCWMGCHWSPTAICWWLTWWPTGKGLQSYFDNFDCAMLICCRFNEWGLASWKVQKDRLLGSSTHSCHWHFLGLIRGEDDGDFSDKLPSQMSALMLTALCLWIFRLFLILRHWCCFVYPSIHDIRFSSNQVIAFMS